MSYPASINSIGERSDGPSEIIYSSYLNVIRTALLDLVTILGNAPQGNKTSIEDRLGIRIDDDGLLKNPQQFVTVGKSNSDFTTISSALTSITDASSDKIYTVFIHPGVYDESVICKPYVNLVGVDKFSCILTRYSSIPLTLASNSNISNLTISGTNDEGNFNSVSGSGVSCSIFNCLISAVTSFSLSLSSSSNVTLYSCTINTCAARVESSTLTAYYCVFNSLDYSNCVSAVSSSSFFAYHSNFLSTTDPCLYFNTDASIILSHCFIQSTADYGVQISTCTSFKVSFCVIISGSNKWGIYLTSSATIDIFNSKVLKDGSATESIHTAAAVTCSIALCSLNAAIDGDITNDISTPYNVIDANVS